MDSEKMPPDSFTFGKRNSIIEWGIKAIAYDVFSAPKRDRRITIPFRHGSYDYGEKYHDNKRIRLDICTEDNRIPDKATMREVIYHLSKKDRLTLWDEQDKYYEAELMDSFDWNVIGPYLKQQVPLEFICSPFAIRHEHKTIPIKDGVNKLEYTGTAPSPTLIIIRNPNAYPITKIALTVIKEKGEGL